MLDDLGHPFARGEPVYDVTFENVQAGLRTDYLFRLANQHDGIVLGTGDLSELALGWCTYGVGDQMSHYNVNAGVPKTLIQHLIRWVIASRPVRRRGRRRRCDAILDTEISPELVPADATGATPQSTEAKVGPYELQDFNLYYTLRYGFRPVEGRVPGAARLGRRGARRLAAGLPGGRGAPPTTCRRSGTGWRCSCGASSASASSSARPCRTGPRSSSGGSLSPRGDWRAPSDGNAAGLARGARTQRPGG